MALQLAAQVFMAVCCAVSAAEAGKANAAARAAVAKRMCKRMKTSQYVMPGRIFRAARKRRKGFCRRSRNLMRCKKSTDFVPGIGGGRSLQQDGDPGLR